jgi:predicted patatin/cPLA2 family phospholipase
MRAVYSMAALAELAAMGFADTIDVVMGASAGGINGAYFLAGQAEAAISVYTHDISSRSFVNPRRVRRVVDIDFMVDVALKNKLPIDQQALLSSKGELRVVVTDAVTGEATFLSTRDNEFDTYEIFRATAAMPILYNRRVVVNGREYIDGGVSDPIPVTEAISQGAGLVISVLTRGLDYRRQANGKISRAAANIMLRGHSDPVRSLLSGESTKLNSALDLLSGTVPPPPGVTLHTVFPSDLNTLVGLGTVDKARLLECAEMGRRDMHALLGAVPNRVCS